MVKKIGSWKWRVALLFGLGIFGARANAQVVVKKPMPTPRMNAAAAVVGDKIYVVGGISGQGLAVATVEEYDPSTDSWTRRTSMPTARGMLAAASVGGIVYAVGGRSASGGVLAVVEAYDVKNDRWRSVPSLPQGRWGIMAAEAAGKLFVLGGITGTAVARQSVTSVEVFDPATNAWSTTNELPVSLQSAAVATYNGHIFVVGGRIGAGDTGEATDSVYIRRTEIAEWTKAPSLLGARTGAAAAVVGSHLVVVGGASAGSLSQRLEMLELPQTANWTRNDSISPAPRTGLVAASVSGKLYAIGGATRESAAGITGLVEEITVSGSLRSNDLTSRSAPPEPSPSRVTEVSVTSKDKATAGPSAAERLPTSLDAGRTAVIDLQRVVSESIEGKTGIAKVQALIQKKAAQSEIQRLQEELQGSFQQKVAPVIRQVATEQGFRVVLSIGDSGIFWADPEVDITNVVIKRLDVITASGNQP